MEPVEIHVSTLNDYAGCARMVAHKVFAADFASFGFPVPEKKNFVAGLTGTAVHASIAALNKIKRDELRLVQGAELETVLEKSVHDFEEATKDGVEYDATTKSFDMAAALIKQQSRLYAAKVLPKIYPRLIEHKVRYLITPETDEHPAYWLVGTLDIFDDAKFLHDAKSGSRNRNHMYQFGGYVLGLQAEGEQVEGTQSIWLKRGGKPQDPVIEPYPVRACRDAAFAMAHQMVADHKLFMKTGNEWAFRGDPNHNLCDPKYCQTFGTAACSLGRKKSEEN